MNAVRGTDPSAAEAWPRSVRARAGGWVLALATGLLIGASVILHSASPGGIRWLHTNLILAPLISALVGAVIVDRKGRHPVGWLFSVSGVFWGTYHLGLAAAAYAASGQRIPGFAIWIWLTGWTPFTAFALAPGLVLFVFPTGRLTSRRWRWPFALAIAATVLGAAGHAFAPGPLEDLPAFQNPFGARGPLGDAVAVVKWLGWPLMMAGAAAGAVSLRERARTATHTQRQQIKWLLLASIALLAFGVFWGTVEALGHPEIALAGAGLFLPLMPLAVGIAILKHRLYDIDVLINRTLVYVSLSAVLAAVYLGAVFLLQRGLSPITRDSNIAIAASTLAVAAVFRPVRGSIQDFIDRRFYRSKYNAAATLSRFATGLRNEVDMDALTNDMLALVGETLQPSRAGLWLKGTDTS